jgi:hypothetical protein
MSKLFVKLSYFEDALCSLFSLQADEKRNYTFQREA